jgi:WD40 repeat protein
VPSAKLEKTISGHEVERSKRVAVRLVLGAGTRMTRSDLAFSADGKAIAASLGNATVRQFDTGTGAEVSPAAGHLSGVIAVGTDGKSVVTVSKESVRVWDVGTGKEVRQWPLAPPAVAAAVSADGTRVATASGGGTVHLWDPATGKKARDLDTKRADVAGLGFSPDGKLLATKAELNAAVNLWDLATGAHVRTIGQDGEPVLSGGRVSIEFSGVQSPAIVFSSERSPGRAAGSSPRSPSRPTGK